MKFAALFLLAVLGTATASLNDDIQEIKALIPIDEIKAITLEFAANDAEFQRVVAYLRSDDFYAILVAIQNTPEWVEFTAYLDESGVNIYWLLEQMWGLLSVPNVIYDIESDFVLQRGFHDWTAAVRALIPTEELVALIKEKVQTSPEFQDLWSRLQSDDFANIARAVVAVDEWQALVQKGRDHGAPVDAWIGLIQSFFGW